MAKRQISAKEVVVDIRDGVSDEELMAKYGLSSDSLQSVFKKLKDAKVLTDAMLAERSSDFNLRMDVPVSPSPRPSYPTVEQPIADDLRDIDPYYLNIFGMIERGKLVKWNWFCFLFAYAWYIYKGMWQKAIVYFIAATLASGITFWAAGIGGMAVWIIMCLMANWDYYLSELHGEKFFTKNWVSWWYGKFPDDLPRRITGEGDMTK